MAFPYISDLVNALLGTGLWIPIPTFGLLVVSALVVASYVAKRNVESQQVRGILPKGTASAVADLALLSSLAGIVGARVFYVVDHLDEFAADPAALIFSRSGFSIYGGLCFGILAGILFLRRRGISILPMLDAVAPALMLGYGIGRLGCQVAGDGDWGIQANLEIKPAWLPDWLWAQTYEGNILGVTIPAPGVYPTPIYEFGAALILFAVLWTLRSGRRPGNLFSVYLLLAGFERLLIEKIRVNVEHEIIGYYLTQAETISLVVIVAGLVGVLVTLNTQALWAKALISLGVLSALSACVPL
jgi:phosphatidylglycerol:prolipoprotein diacylglycerol transferase